MYELWIFCEVPFACYHGRIEISSGREAAIHQVNVKRYRLPFGAPRSNSAPIVWRCTNASASEAETKCRVAFRLVPSFAGTDSLFGFETHEQEYVTFLIRIPRANIPKVFSTGKSRVPAGEKLDGRTRPSFR